MDETKWVRGREQSQSLLLLISGIEKWKKMGNQNYHEPFSSPSLLLENISGEIAKLYRRQLISSYLGFGGCFIFSSFLCFIHLVAFLL